MNKKFTKREPKKKWTLEQTYQRRSLVDEEIANINRTMNAIDKHTKHLLLHVKQNLMKAVANKWTYRRQLQEQIKEQRLAKGLPSTKEVTNT